MRTWASIAGAGDRSSNVFYRLPPVLIYTKFDGIARFNRRESWSKAKGVSHL